MSRKISSNVINFQCEFITSWDFCASTKVLFGIPGQVCSIPPWMWMALQFGFMFSKSIKVVYGGFRVCVFACTACLILCGIENALLTSIVVIPFSHNNVASLCCCNVDHFIHVVAISEVWLQIYSKHNS